MDISQTTPAYKLRPVITLEELAYILAQIESGTDLHTRLTRLLVQHKALRDSGYVQTSTGKSIDLSVLTPQTNGPVSGATTNQDTEYLPYMLTHWSLNAGLTGQQCYNLATILCSYTSGPELIDSVRIWATRNSTSQSVLDLSDTLLCHIAGTVYSAIEHDKENGIEADNNLTYWPQIKSVLLNAPATDPTNSEDSND